MFPSRGDSVWSLFNTLKMQFQNLAHHSPSQRPALLRNTPAASVHGLPSATGFGAAPCTNVRRFLPCEAEDPKASSRGGSTREGSASRTRRSSAAKDLLKIPGKGRWALLRSLALRSR